MKRIWIRIAWIVALIVAVSLVVQAFVCDVYRVDSGSMEPTLHGPDRHSKGESVLVYYGKRHVGRFELVILRRPDEEEPIVKRVVGLPGESVQISNGDLLIEGRRLPIESARPEPIVVFDERVHPIERGFPELAQLGTRISDVWQLDPRSKGMRIPFAPRVTDGFWNASNEWVDGEEFVNDLGARLEYRLVSSDAEISLIVTEEGDRFRARVVRDNSGGLLVELARAGADGAWAVLDSSVEPHGLDGWHALGLDNFDNALVVHFDGAPKLVETYMTNSNLTDAPDPRLSHRLPRVELFISSGPVELRGLAVVRDRFYARRGTIGVDAPIQLGPDEVLVLGDNSSKSFDSRQYGPVKLSDLIGRPGAVLWPWSAIRRLDGPKRLVETAR
ncbi:MAG: signal peptidase I [Planctomycetes bacterium]|nr:signal peptidase I [Planctomycetota bacterium]